MSDGEGPGLKPYSLGLVAVAWCVDSGGGVVWYGGVGGDGGLLVFC